MHDRKSQCQAISCTTQLLFPSRIVNILHTEQISDFAIIPHVAHFLESISSVAICSNEPGSAGLKFPQDKRTACEKFDYDECEKRDFGGSTCENIYELFWDNDCFGFVSAKECDEHFNNLGPSDNDNNLFEQEEEDGITNISMQKPFIPLSEPKATISDLLRLLLTPEISSTDRLLLISELEQLLQSLFTDTTTTINVELDTRNDGNEKVLTITRTTSMLTEE